MLLIICLRFGELNVLELAIRARASGPPRKKVQGVLGRATFSFYEGGLLKDLPDTEDYEHD